MKRNKGAILIVCVAFLCAILGFALGAIITKRGLLCEDDREVSKLQETFNLIRMHYVDSVELSSLSEKLIPSLMEHLDPHSKYLTAEERDYERHLTEGYFYGIGIEYNLFLDTIVVDHVAINGPADLVGVQAGDRIIQINGQNVTGAEATPESVKQLIYGPEKSLVNLTILRGEEQTRVDIQVSRGYVPMSEIGGAFMTSDSVGVIALTSFGKSTYDDLMSQMARLQKLGAKAYILDLRDNPGGLMSSAVLIANEFIKLGATIIYTEGRHFEREVVASDGKGNYIGTPLYILINESSASSSEIIAGAIQDNDAGIIVGKRSFGKGLVQRVFDYEDGSALHLTIARYYTASGRSIQRDYKMGKIEEYEQSYYNRLRADMESQKSEQASKIYYTLNGRKVFGGGGILPDVEVDSPFESQHNSYLQQLLESNMMAIFSFYYADQYRDLLSDFEDAEACYAFLQNQGIAWQVGQFAARNGIRMKNYLIAQAKKNNRIVRELCNSRTNLWKSRGLSNHL